MTDKIIIREAHMGDSAGAAVLNVETFKAEFDFTTDFESDVLKSFSEYSGGLQYPSMLWVAECDGRIVGSVSIFGRGKNEGQLRWFCVTPDLQYQGIGTRLLKTALDFCESNGYDNIFLWSIDILKPAIHLYNKFGFRSVVERENAEWSSSGTLVDIKMIKGYN